MPAIAWLGLIVALAVLLIVLEGRRQARKLRARGEHVSDRPGLMGAGVLELQAMLESDRKVETLQQEARGEHTGETRTNDDTET